MWDRQKATESIIYLADRLSPASSARVVKVFIFADLIHLQKYGRLIAGDYYKNTRSGPEPSETYQLMLEACPPRIGVDGFRIEQGEVKAKRGTNRDEFSVSDLECLDMAIGEYGSVSMSTLIKLALSNECQILIEKSNKACLVNRPGQINE